VRRARGLELAPDRWRVIMAHYDSPFRSSLRLIPDTERRSILYPK